MRLTLLCCLLRLLASFFCLGHLAISHGFPIRRTVYSKVHDTNTTEALKLNILLRNNGTENGHCRFLSLFLLKYY